MHRIVRFLAAGSAAFTVIGATLGPAGTARAATSLSVTLSASGTGASAVWNAAGDPVLTVGTPSDTTYAEITINSPPTVESPTTALIQAQASSASPDPNPFNNFSTATIKIGGLVG